MKDYYLILGIEPNATTDEIKKAYRAMSMKYHPDKNKGDKYFEERFKDINESYDTLSNIERRKDYDYKWLNHFKKSTGDSSSKSDTSKQDWINRKEQELRSKEQEIRNREQQLSNLKEKLSKKEAELLKVAEGLNRQKTSFGFNNQNKGVIGIGILFLLVVLVIVSRIPSQRNEKLSNEIETLRYENDSIKQKNDTLISAVRIFSKGYNEQKKLIKNLEKKKAKVWTPPADAIPVEPKQVKVSQKYLANRVLIKNIEDIEITNLEWVEYVDNTQAIKTISVFNKMDLIAINKVWVIYEINDTKGSPINSGEFVINSKEMIDPKKTKAISSPYSTFFVSKNRNNVLILTIKDFMERN